MVHAARSARGGACATWQDAQRAACAPTEWRPGKRAGAWQLAHAGGAATPFGPWARWQVAQPPGSPPWSAVAFAAWQVAHVAPAPPVPALALAPRTLAREPECASWQATQRACPAGAVFASAAWHEVQAGFATGVCAAPWHPAHVAWPARAPFASAAWQRPQRAAPAAAPESANVCGVWQPAHAGPLGPGTWSAWSSRAFVWHDEQAAATFGVFGCAAWQPVHPTPAGSARLDRAGWAGWTSAWQRTHARAGARVPSPRACGSWQLVQAACSGTVAEASAETPVWQPLHAEPALVGAWGAWQVTHAAWPALGRLPPWQVALWHERTSAFVAAWG